MPSRSVSNACVRRLPCCGPLRTVAFLAAPLVACTSSPDFGPITGTPASTATSGTVYELDVATVPDGLPPFLGATDLVMLGGKMSIAPTAESGQTAVAYTMRGGGDSTLSIDATVPFGAQIVMGRGRLRDPSNKAGLGVIFAPSADATVPSSFLIALAGGRFVDPLDGAAKDLGCSGAPLGPTWLLRSNPSGNPLAATTFSLDGFLFDLQKAPQLASLAAETKSGAVHVGPLTEAAATYALTLRKTAGGSGSVEAKQGADVLFAGPYPVRADAVAGTSMACKIAHIQCVSLCKAGAGPLLFGAGCDEASCSNQSARDPDGPEPVDFQLSETCRQTAAWDESCHAPLRATSQTATTYRVAVNEVFGDAVDTNQFLIQLVRSKLTGLSPSVTAIRVTR